MLPAQRNFITDKLFLLRLDRIFTQIKTNSRGPNPNPTTRTRTPNYEPRRYPNLSFFLRFGKCLTYIPTSK